MVQLTSNSRSDNNRQTIYSSIRANLLDSNNGTFIFETNMFHKMSITVRIGSIVVLIQGEEALTFTEGETYSLDYPELNTQKLTVAGNTGDSVAYITYQAI